MCNFAELSQAELTDLLFEEIDEHTSLERIRSILNTGANVKDENLILVAISSNRLDIVQLLVEAGADVNQIDSSDWETPLLRAKELKFDTIADYLETLVDPIIRDYVNLRITPNQKGGSRKDEQKIINAYAERVPGLVAARKSELHELEKLKQEREQLMEMGYINNAVLEIVSKPSKNYDGASIYWGKLIYQNGAKSCHGETVEWIPTNQIGECQGKIQTGNRLKEIERRIKQLEKHL
jgi:hypothetical protein